jgi:hypothetical protein
MKIIKHVTHQSIDCLFKAAFQDDIKYVWMRPPYEVSKDDPRYAVLEPIFTHDAERLGEYVDTETEYDWVIIDDPFSMQMAKQLRAKRYLFYVHMSDHQESLIDDLKALHERSSIIAVAPTEHKRSTFKSYFPIGGDDIKVIHPAVWEGLFQVPISKKRNGRILLITNNLQKRVKRYPESMPCIQTLFSRFNHWIDVYGRKTNTSHSRGFPWRPYSKGLCKDVRPLNNYQTAVFPLIHDSPAIAMLDCMALGIPVVTMPREGFRETNDGCFVANTTDEFMDHVHDLLQDIDTAVECGKQARDNVDVRFDSKTWCDKIKDFMGVL